MTILPLEGISETTATTTPGSALFLPNDAAVLLINDVGQVTLVASGEYSDERFDRLRRLREAAMQRVAMVR